VHIRIIAVGKVKKPYYRAALDDYLGRLSHYCRCDEVEVKASKKDEKKGARVAIRAEGDALDAAAPRLGVRIALDERGRGLGSVEFARVLGNARDQDRDVSFFIGGALGLDEKVVGTCSQTLSLSAMTLPHELARVVLAEQLYRAMTIMAGEPYHK
jgi:23S rRNA (pseudouridine1915-N3)-methyltransferase